MRLWRVESWVVRREGVRGVVRRRVEREEARALISEWSVSIMVEKVGGCWGEGGGWGLEGMDFVCRGLVGGWWGWVYIGRGCVGGQKGWVEMVGDDEGSGEFEVVWMLDDIDLGSVVAK